MNLKISIYKQIFNNFTNFQVVTVGTLLAKGQPRFVNGKWNPHNMCNQFVTLNDNNVRGWDFRNPKETAWSIISGHSQTIRFLIKFKCFLIF